MEVEGPEDQLTEEAFDAMECSLPLCPPPLRHQRSSDMRFDEEPQSPVYRSLSVAERPGSSQSFDEYEDEPVYRSMACLSGLDLEAHTTMADHGIDAEDYGYSAPSHCEAGPSAEYKEAPVYRGGRASLSALLNAAPSAAETNTINRPSPDFVFELPAELLDMVLHLLSPCPDLFSAMLVSISWRDAARLNYANRQRTIPAAPDALLSAVACAWPGDTLLVAAGFHSLSSEIAVDKPLRLLAAPGAGDAVLTSTHHVLLRTRCSALVEGVTLLRMGDEVGYPNAVVYAEAGSLTMRGCRITCGGAAPSPEHAMQVFQGVPAAGEEWDGSERPAAVEDPAARAEDRGQDPQSGLWVGAAARVHLRRSLILCCQGPGIKIYRGELEAVENTIAFASRGANVVANGGKVKLLCNEIKGALGDGVSSWNNSQLSLEDNRVHSNSGAGVAINTGGGAVSITNNKVYDNCCSAVLFATSQTKQATLTNNDLERNAAGGVQGLHQVGNRPGFRQPRRGPEQPHLQRVAFEQPPPLLPQRAAADDCAGPSSESFPDTSASMEM